MKKNILHRIIKILASGLLFVFVAFLLALTVKGVSGNPSPMQIRNELEDATEPFELSPERGRYAIVQSLVEDKSFYFSDQIAEYVAPDLGYKNGNFVSLFAPGISILALPFYYVGARYDLAQVATFSFSALIALFNFYLIYLLVASETKNKTSGIVSGIIFTFATNAWAYSTTLYQHHMTAFLLLLTLYLLSKPLRKLTPFVVAFIAGIGFMVEYPNILFFVPLFVLLVSKAFIIKEYKESVSLRVYPWIVGSIIGIALALIPSFWYNYHSYGSVTQLASTVRGSDEFDVNWESGEVDEINTISYNKSALSFFSLERLPNSMTVLLTSPDRGIVIYAPIILFGILGFYPLIKRKNALGMTILAEVLIIFLLYGMWGDPWGGWAFGPRYLVPVSALMSVMFGIAMATYGKKIWFMLLSLPVFLYSLTVSIVGAFTTNQLPPSVEIDYLRFPKYLFLHGVDLIKEGTTGSFVYNTYLHSFVSLRDLVILVWGVLVLVYLVLVIYNALKEEKYEI